jgi:TRAP-type C4-dicarboxylate transport system permease small subunit
VLLIVLLAAMVVIVFANVVMRYVFGTSVIWSEEVARHLMIWMTFVGSGLALRTGAQLGIDSLQNALPPRGARWLRIALAAGMLALFVLLAWYGVDYALRTRFQISAALGMAIAAAHSGEQRRVVAVSREGLEIRRGQLGNGAGRLGAAWLARDRLG